MLSGVARVRLLLLFAACLPLRHGAAQYTDASTANAAAIAASVSTLSALGRPLNVGLVNILPPSAPTQVGVDGFSRLLSVSSPAASAILAAPLNSSVPVNASDVQGVLPWLYAWLAAQAGINISYSVFRLPAAAQSSADLTTQVLAALTAGGFDSVTLPLGMSPGRLAYMRMLPLQGYGYTVVTTRPAPTAAGLWDRAFIWAAPFTWSLWLTFACSIVFSSFVMLFFEKGRNKEQFDNESIGSNMEAVGHSMFLSAMGATLKEMYAPATAAGRVYTSTTAFVIYLIMSIYVANLAAVFTTSPAVSADITDITSFVAKGLPVCARNVSGQIAWINDNYPDIAQNGLLVVPGVTVNSVLDGILSGVCAGGISTTSDVSFALGMAGDPQGTYCNLLPVGDTLDSFLYALPFTANTTLFSPAAFDAVSKLISYAIFSGNYTTQALATWMPDDSNRPQCAALVAANTANVDFAQSGALDVHDLAGVFLIQVAGFVTASAFYVSKEPRKALYSALSEKLPERLRLKPPSHLRKHVPGDADDDLTALVQELSVRLADVAARRQAAAAAAAAEHAAAPLRAEATGGRMSTEVMM